MHLIYASHQFLAPPNPWVLGMSFSWQVDYSDVLDRVVALPVALTWEEGAQKSRCHPDHSFTRVEARHGSGIYCAKLPNCNPCSTKSLNLGLVLYNVAHELEMALCLSPGWF